mgnify:CR=1 FL=1
MSKRTFPVYYGQNIFEDAEIKHYDVGTSIEDILIDLDADPEKVSVMFDGDSLDYQPKANEAVVMKVVPEGVDPLSWTAIAIYVAAGLAVGYLAYMLAPEIGDFGPNEENKRYRIDGAKNEPKPYEPVPMVLGKRRVVPSYAAAPYTEFEGDDEWFNMLLCFGSAPLRIRDIRIGDTPIDTYECQYKLLDWYENADENDVRRLWPDDVAQEPINVDITHVSDDGGDMSLDIGYTEGWTTRTTSGFGDEVAVDVIFPQGAVRMADDGAGARTSAFQYQYQEEDGTWTTRARLAKRVHDNEYHWPAPYCIWQSLDTGDYYVIGTNGHNYRNKTRINASTSINITQYVEGIEDTGAGEYLTIKGYTGTVASDFISTSSNAQKRRSIRHELPAYSRDTETPVNLRVRKVFPKESPDDSKRIDAIKWQYIRTYRDLSEDDWNGTYVFNKTSQNIDGFDYYSFRPVLMALRVKATDQLSGVIDNLNAECTQVVPAEWSFDWRKWTDKVDIPAGSQTGELVPTEDPPSAYRWILQGPGQDNPLANDRIDIDGIFQWRERCIQEGWKISSLLDYDSTVLKELQNVAFTGRAEFGYIDGKYSVVEKVERTYPVQVFTPKNSWDFRSERNYPEQTDGIRFEFENEDTDYQKDEGIFYDPTVYDPDQNIDNRTGKFEGVELWGVSNADLAYRHARFAYYEKALRRETYQFSTDLEGLVATRGDLVRLQNDIIDIGLGSGRVTFISGTTFELDEKINLVVGNTYGIEFRTPTEEAGDYIHLITAVYNADGTFTGNIPSYIQEGDFAIYGEVGSESLDVIITNVAYTEDLQCNVTCVNAANEIFTLDGNPVPVFETGLTDRIDWRAPAAPTIDDSVSIDPTNRTLNIAVLPARNDLLSTREAVLEYRAYPIGETADTFFESENAGWTRLSQIGVNTTYQFFVQSPVRGNVYQFRARVVNFNGMYSPLSRVSTYTLNSDPAEQVLGLYLSEFIDTPPTPDQRFSTITVEVTPPDDPNYLGSVIEYRKFGSQTWREVGRVDSPDVTIQQVLESDGTEYEFRARSVSVFGEISEGGVIEAIKVINLLSPDYEDGLPETDESIPNVTGLELFGQGNDTEFTGRDAKFSWRKSTVEDWLELGNEGARGASGTALDQFFKDYLVEIWADGELIRLEEVVDNHYTYDYEKNVKDYFDVNGEVGAWRSFQIRVWQRSRAGQISPTPAVLDVENPAPQLPNGLYATAGFKNIIVGWEGEPTDTDFEGVMIWLSTDNVEQENLVYRGRDNLVNLQGVVLRDEFGNPLLEIESGTEYRVDIAPYDSFGYVGIAPTTTYNITTESLTDRDTNKTKPCPPGSVAAVEGNSVKKLLPNIYVDVTWDATVGVWDEDTSSCNLGQDPGIVTGYYVQWWETGEDVSEIFTSSLTERVSNLEPNTEYNFRVKAIDWAGNESPWSDTVTLATQGDSAPPADASTVNLTAGLDKIIVDWVNPADEDWQVTKVYLGTSSSFTASSANLRYEGRANSTIIGDVSNGVSYYVRLQTVDTSGNESTVSASYGPVVPFKISNVNSDQFVENLAIAEDKIANAAISTGKIANGAISNVKIANSAVDSNKLSNLSVTASKLAGSSVTSTKIANAAVGNAAIANLAVSNAKIQDAAITTAKIQDAAITTALIDNAAITTAKIDNAAITTAKIDNAAITEAKIDNLAVTDAKIANLDAAKITTGTLNANRIGANSISASKINVTNLSSISADVGNLTAGTITGVLYRTGTTNPRVTLSTGGLRAYNISGTRTVDISSTGAATFGTGQDAISIDTSGNVTIPGTLLAGDIVSNTFRTSPSGSRVEIGPNVDNSGRMLQVYSGSTRTFEVDTSGNVSLTGNVTITGGSGIGSFSDAGALAEKDAADSGDVTFNYAGSTSKGGNANNTNSVGARSSSTVVDGVDRARGGLNSSGDVRRTIVGPYLPTSNPNFNGLHLNRYYFGFYENGSWRNYFRSNGDALIGNSASNNYVFWDDSAGTLDVRGRLVADDIYTGTLNAGVVSVTNLDADNITSGTLNAINITGSTITGSTLRTSDTTQRVEISDSTNDISFYDSTGANVVRIGPTSTDNNVYAIDINTTTTTDVGAGLLIDTAYRAMRATVNVADEPVVQFNNFGGSSGATDQALVELSRLRNTTTLKQDFISFLTNTTTANLALGFADNSGDPAYTLSVRNRASPFPGADAGPGGKGNIDLSHIYHSGLGRDARGAIIMATHDYRPKGYPNDYTYGVEIAGSFLQPANVSGSSQAVTLSGTYMCLGATEDNTNADTRTTLWVKIDD